VSLDGDGLRVRTEAGYRRTAEALSGDAEWRVSFERTNGSRIEITTRRAQERRNPVRRRHPAALHT
jgi:hypothetical protein